MKFAILITLSYLLGSVPFAVIIARAHGKDLRKTGSGNIGATNLARATGKKWGYICFLLDMTKGLLPAFLATSILVTQQTPLNISMAIAVAAAAVIGHIFPIYLGFKGGKGVATSFGVALGLWPWFTVCAAIAVAIWAAVVIIWKYISLGSIIAALAFPLVLTAIVLAVDSWQFQNLWPLFIAAAAIPVLVIIRHRQNIKRLLKGTENKIANKKSSIEKETP